MDRKNGEIMLLYSFNNAIASAYEHMILPCLIFHIRCMGKRKLNKILYYIGSGAQRRAAYRCTSAVL